MYEYQTEMRVGEQAPAYAQITVPGSSTTFTSSSAFFQLLWKDHSPVTAPVDFTTAQTAAITSDVSKVYFNLPASVTTTLAVTDWYVGRFIQYGTPDSIQRVKYTDVQIVMIY